MKLLGISLPSLFKRASMAPVDNRGGWWPMVREPFAGAWQQNIEWTVDDVLRNPYVMRCVSLISGDIAAMRIRLVALEDSGIWSEVNSPAFSPILKKPNRLQTRIQFYANWVESKLVHGNAYALKERDNRNVVSRLYVLNPTRVQPLVADTGDVFYRLYADELFGIGDGGIVVPASEIIHDRWNTFYHPLVGISPLHSIGLAALQGIRIQTHSTKFFENAAQPGGILTAPGAISDETAERLKTAWMTNFSGSNAGRVAVLGDNLHYEPMAYKASDSQQVEQFKASAEAIAGAFGVPAHKIGIGGAPTYNNVEALQQQYYNDALRRHIEDIELCLDEGLELPQPYGTEFDLDDLLRMDTTSMAEAMAKLVGAGIIPPNVAAKKFGYGPYDGGDTPYLQQQNYSLEALAKRDALGDPFGKAALAAPEPAKVDEPKQVSAYRFKAKCEGSYQRAA